MSEYLFPNEPSRFNVNFIDEFLKFYVENNASDITFQTNSHVMVEIKGRLHKVTKRALTQSEVSEIINGIYGANATAQLLSGSDLDTQYETRIDRNQRNRFRVNATGCLVDGSFGIQITLRSIPNNPPHLKDISLDENLQKALIPTQGIVIVSGATGSGKSTLLAAIMRELLENENGKILSYESPIEFVYDSVVSESALISQSEIPLHLPDFPRAVRNALRRKPEYILVGEARDKETISAVIDAALTGHTVYTTVHSNGVADTIRRMVSSFPQEERYGRTVDLISMTRAIIWQMLVPTEDGGRHPVREWLIFSPEVRSKLFDSIN